MKYALATTALAAGLLAITTPTPSHAADFKMYHGSGCKVFGSTAWTDLHFAASGIFNLTDSPKNIICPIIKDSDAPWDGNDAIPVNAASVHLHWTTGSAPASMACNVYVSDADGILLETTSFNSGIQLASGKFDETLDGLDSFGESSHTEAMMLCTMGPRTSLQYYSVYEQGDTN